MSIKWAILFLFLFALASVGAGFIKGAIQQRKANKEAAKNAPPEEKHSDKDDAKDKKPGKDDAEDKKAGKGSAEEKKSEKKTQKKPKVKKPKRLQ